MSKTEAGLGPRDPSLGAASEATTSRPGGPPLPQWPGTGWAWVIVGLACAFAAYLRWRVLDVPLERDEGEYAYFGQLLLRGLPPFREAYSMKLPGTQLAYAAAMAVFGETIAGVRLGLLLANAGTIVCVFLLGRRLLGTLGGVTAAIAFACLSASIALLGIFGHATHFVILPAVAGLVLLLRAVESGRLLAFFGSGFLLGLALIAKQPGAVFLAFAAAWVLWQWLLQGRDAGERRWRTLLAKEGALLAGAALPLALVGAWIVVAGTSSEAWLWSIDYARQYTGIVSPPRGVHNLQRQGANAVAAAWVLWGLAGLGALLTAWPGGRIGKRAFILGLLAFSFVGMAAGLYFRPHYFILGLPAVAFLVGTVPTFVAGRVVGGPGRAAALAALALACAGYVQAVWTERDVFFGLSPDKVSRRIYGPSPFPESLVVARYLAARTRPDDRVLVLGSEPQIYFYAGRRAATGHVYMYALMEPQPFATAMQRQMAAEVEAARPAYIVWADVPDSWVISVMSNRWILEWANRFARRNYDVVGQVLIRGPDRTDYYWDEAAGQAPPSGLDRLIVYRRKDFVPRSEP